MKKIGVVGVPEGWSSELLADTVAERTGYRLLVDMAHARLDLEDGKLWYNGTDLTSLDALIVKKIAPSYSPDVLDRLEMLRFASDKVPTFSKPASILRLIDRLSCTVTLRQGGLPMPATTITEDLDEAVAAVESYGRAVFKPLYSTKARGMTVIEPGPQAATAVQAFLNSGNHVMYIQQMVKHPGKDLGVTFLGGEYMATYARQGSGKSWDTTTRTGGKYVNHEPSQEIIDLAHKAQALFDMAFTCVDVVETPDGPLLYEVSAFGGFRGLKDACGIDAAGQYVDWVLKEIA